MSKSNTGLTDDKCASLTFSGSGKNKLFDGAGLYLEVTTSGSKRWRMRYKQKNGKETLITFGEYPAVSLEQARQARERVREAVKKGEDPTKVRDSLQVAETTPSQPASSVSAVKSSEKNTSASTSVPDIKKTSPLTSKEEVTIPASLTVSPAKSTTDTVVNTPKATETKSVSSPAPSVSTSIPTKATGFSASPSAERVSVAASTTDKTEKITVTSPTAQQSSSSAGVHTESTTSSTSSGKNQAETGFVSTASEKPVQSSAIPKHSVPATKSTVTPISSNVTRINSVQKPTGVSAPTPVRTEEGSGKKVLLRTILFTLLVAGGVFLFEEYRLSNTNTALQQSQKRLAEADVSIQQNAILNGEIRKLEQESVSIKQQNEELVSVNDRLKASHAELEQIKNEAVQLREQAQIALDKAMSLNAVLQKQLQEIRAELAQTKELYQSEKQARSRAQQSLQVEQQRAEQINRLRDEFLRGRGQ